MSIHNQTMQRGLGLILILVWVIAIIVMLFMLKKSVEDDSMEGRGISGLSVTEMTNNGENWLMDI